MRRKKIKTILKAVVAVTYIYLGIAFTVGAVTLIFMMYLSGTFLPVYVGKSYILGNQILRYMLYGLLGAIIFFSAKLAKYGAQYLIRKFQRRKGR